MAADARLIAVSPNDGSLLEDGQILHTAPTDLTFRFDETTVLDANDLEANIILRRSGKDGIFTNNNVVTIVPGFIGLGDSSNEAIVRFAERLPDDRYELQVFDTTMQFTLDLGATITAVVPQPISQFGGVREQARNQIAVYFNDDDLNPASAEDPGFYQLVFTNDTVSNLDDGSVHRPIDVDYDAQMDRAILTFSRDISQLSTGAGTYRLRVGTDERRPNAPETIAVGFDEDPGSSFDTAMNLEVISNTGKVLSSRIDIPEFSIDYPGDNESPGHRDLSYHREQHIFDSTFPEITPIKDETLGVETVAYMFRTTYGEVQGVPLPNLITDPQKERIREIASLYSYYAGVQFFEADEAILDDLLDQGITVFSIATGDLRVVDPTVPTGKGGVIGIAGASSDGIPTAVMDQAEDWDDSFGANWFETAMHEVGHLLGLGHTYDLAPGTVMGNYGVAGYQPEPVFPGDHDIIHAKHLHRPESTDIDLYRFELENDGLFTAETFAERRTDASLLDTVISVFEEDENGNRVLIARNDNYFSDDSFVELSLESGVYFVGVSAAGNDEYDPNIQDGGHGGRSQGEYDLRLNFRPQVDVTIVDSTGTSFDGDFDGTPGGVFNFWFRAEQEANTLFVDKAATNGGDGSLQAPYNNLKDAIDMARSRAQNEEQNLIVRVLGNGGADGDESTAADNFSYQIGFDSSNRPLEDGSTLEIPANVTVMVDEGAIFKLRRARIGVGSSTPSVDRSASGFQVLGTPTNTVIFTSINDESVGGDTTTLTTTPQPGDWGGILFRNDVDRAEGRFEYEENGIFLNSVNHAEFFYGGGEVVIESVLQVVAPIQMIEARPSIAFNSISNSADAAMSADPNSFEETNFHAPIYQGTLFTSDYSRIGPQISNNRLDNNSINGLFVRIQTQAGTEPKTLSVAGRWNDQDIVHVVSENLIVEGSVGGPIRNVTRAPSALTVIQTPGQGGQLPAGDYTYKFTFVEPDGSESPASGATAPLTLLGRGIQGTVVFTNLPQPEVGSGIRRIRFYRSATSGIAPYTFAGEALVSDLEFVDNGAIQNGRTLADTNDLRARNDASLVIDPGTVVKLDGAHIDVSFGGQLIAEGRDGAEIIFTSVRDDRFGAGSTFDTNNDRDRVVSNDPKAGDWGGIFVGQTSSASIDNSFFAYGGGINRIEGTFTGFNTIEIHQAEARIANSIFESNADGTGGQSDSDRLGRGFNGSGTIFVRGAQPVIINNTIQNNDGAAININPGALNANLVSDYGQSTGTLDAVNDWGDNQGALIRGNLIGGNAFNGMIVRGEVINTESVWDDTDIVHIVLDEVVVPDFHESGGLRLESSVSSSLVVKLSGENAGLTATGNKLDNDDRIGGSVRLIGQPGFPVVMTSLRDDSIGAGFDPDGRVQVDTDGNGTRLDPEASLPRGPEVNNGTLIDNDVVPTTPGFFSTLIGGGGDVLNSAATIQTQAQVLQNQNLIFLLSNYIDVGGNGQAFNLAATNVTLAPTLIEHDVVASQGEFVVGIAPADTTISWRVESRFEDGDPTIHNQITLFTEEVGDTLGAMRVINYFDPDIVGPGGDIVFTRGTPGESDFRTFIFDDAERIGFAHGGAYSAGDGLVNARYRGFRADLAGVLLNQITVGNGAPYSVNGSIDVINLPEVDDQDLGTVNGPADVATAFAWDVANTRATSATVSSFVQLISRNPTSLAGDWRGIQLDEYSNDRNVAIATEQEGVLSGSVGVNDMPDTAQFLGQIAPFERGGDDNRRLGFEVHGYVRNASDADVYSFRGIAGTEVWLDLDNTSPGLNSVIELLDANGVVLAGSDNSTAEQMSTSPVIGIGKTMDRSAFSIPDRYTTNIHDAGLRVTLPGASGAQNNYHVRVRSEDATTGGYKLQIRLRELDEVPGSTVLYADIRNAVNGIEIFGQPAHSPLLGEASEILEDDTNNNDVRANAQNLGNVVATDRGSLVLQASFRDSTDIDWYQFEARLENVQTILDDPENPEYVGITFDVDYTDGFGRPNTALWLFDEDGTLIFSSDDSAIEDDRPTESGAVDVGDLQAGSAGGKDPFLGTVELPEGNYFLAVTNQRFIPDELVDNPALRAEPVNSLIRIAEDRIGSSGGSNIAEGPTVPILFTENFSLVFPNVLTDLPDGEAFTITDDNGNSVTYELDSDGQVSGTNIRIPFDPLFDTGFALVGRMQNAILTNGPLGVNLGFSTLGNVAEVVINGAVGVSQIPAPGRSSSEVYVSKPSNTPFRLGDVTTFVTMRSGVDQSRLITIDPYTGAFENVIGIFEQNVEDITIRPDDGGAQGQHGLLYGYTVPDMMPDDANSGNYISINHQSLDTQNLSTLIGDDTISTFFDDGQGQPTQADDGVQFQAITINGGIREELTGFAIGHRGLFNPAGVAGPVRNLLYEFDVDTGTAFSLEGPDPVDRDAADTLQGGGTQIRERGQLDLFTDIPEDGGDSSLSIPNATDIDDSDESIARLTDGLQFAIDGTLFELNTGPEVNFDYDPVNDIFVRDGDVFQLDQMSYEFDTGTVLVVTANSGGGIFEGETITLTDDQIPAVRETFEFDSDNVVSQGNIPIPYTTAFDQFDIINAIVTRINAVGNFSIQAEAIPNSPRISLIGENDTFGAIVNAVGITDQGAPGTSAIAIPVEETMTPDEFGQAIVDVIAEASFDGDRINFPTFLQGDFRQIEARGVFQQLPSDGTVTAGAFGIEFGVADTGFEVANKAEAVILAETPIVVTSPGASLQLDPNSNSAFTLAQPELRIGGQAPGGDITGLAIVNGTLYGVSSGHLIGDPNVGGGLYRIVGPPSFDPFTGDPLPATPNVLTNAARADYIETSTDLLTGGRDFNGELWDPPRPIEFVALSAGPDNLEDGRYAEMLFGLDFWGNMYAMDLQGRLQPVFQDSRVSVNTGLIDATGFAFSTLDMNLWHTTDLRREDDGHGYDAPPDFSRRAEEDAGNLSLYFGFENPNDSPGNWANYNDPGFRNTYDFPGGAHGSVESNTFDLSDYSPLDKPTLYFNYFLDTEQAIGDVAPPPFMRDSFRVFASTDDGEWQLLATNNEFTAAGEADDEFDHGGITDVQLLQDSAVWQTIRADMSPFAGSDSVRVRFDFNSAGSFDQGNAFTGGVELRAVEASKIADGETVGLDPGTAFPIFQLPGAGIASEVFEFDFGYVLAAPNGASIFDGETFEVEETFFDEFNVREDRTIAFEFDLGDGVASGNVPVLFDTGFSAAEMAEALESTILAAFDRGVSQADLRREQNDVISQSVRTSVQGGMIAADGFIGDNPVLFGPQQGSDVDLIQVVLRDGQRIVVDVDTDFTDPNALADSYIRLFGADGTEFASNDDGFNPNEPFFVGLADSYLDVTVGQAGTYYIGISSDNNTLYNPFVEGSGIPGRTGAYSLDIQIFGDDTDLTSHRRDALVNLKGVTSVSTPLESGLSLVGTPGTFNGNFPIDLHINMSDDEVAFAFRGAMASAFGSGDPLGIPGFNDVIQVLGHNVVDPGPFGVSSTGFFDEDELLGFPSFDVAGLDGDLFGAFHASTLFDGSTDQDFPGFLRGRDNGFEGVYIDDIVIGFAERGEMYTGAREGVDTFFERDPEDYEDETLQGDYQLTIRPSQSYGVRVIDPEIKLFLTEAFDPRDRLADSVTVTVKSGADISDGAKVSVGDGSRDVILEFEDRVLNNGISAGSVAVPFSNLDTSETIANAMVAVINSTRVQNIIDVRAASPAGSNRIELFGNPVIDPEIGLLRAEVSESNETLDTAIETEIGIDGGRKYIGLGEIGDNPLIGINTDVDLLRFRLEAGQRIDIDVDSVEAPFDSILRLFDEFGNEITSSDDDSAPGELNSLESFISYTSTLGGTYYAGVTGFSNRNYDPNVFGSGRPGSLGEYQITIEIGSSNPVAEVSVEKGFGDQNPFRDQGQVIIESTRITNSAQYGIAIDEGTRTDPDQFAHQGAPRTLFITNEEGWFTGVTVKNNVIAYNREGAIRYSGDPGGPDLPAAPVPFGRIVNNTLVGGRPFQLADVQDTTPLGVGLKVDENVSPTILNNIITNFEIGIDVDTTSQTTVVGGSLYQNNIANSNIGLGDAPIVLQPNDELFVNADAGNFYLAENTPAIDSSINVLNDRQRLVSMTANLGVSVSPILAPDLDITGLLRVDDPRVDTPAGQGENVFKDRGAIDRADFFGPSAVLANPQDNDENDLNPGVSVVQVNNPVVPTFEIQLFDGLNESQIQRGTGIDANTVVSTAVSITQNNQPLIEGSDYLFSYDTSGRIIRLTPLSGIWQPGRVYVITVDNSGDGIKDLANNALASNQDTGITQFTISIGGEDQDFGDAPAPFPTLLLDNGASHVIESGLFLGSSINSEPNGQPSDSADADTDDGVQIDGSLVPGRTGAVRVTASREGQLDAWIDFNQDGDWNDSGERIVRAETLSQGVNTLDVEIPAGALLGSTFARFRFSRDGNLGPTGLALSGEVEDYQVFVVSANPWQNPVNALDASNDGHIAPLDALLIINELNSDQISDPATGLLPNPPIAPNTPEEKGFLDTDGDGYVSPRDALLVINELNQNPNAGAVAAVAIVGESIDDAVVQAALAFPEEVAADKVDQLVLEDNDENSQRKSLDVYEAESLFDIESRDMDLTIDDMADEIAAYWNDDDKLTQV